LNDFLGAETEDSSRPTRVAIALDGVGQEWELLVQHFFVDGAGMCSQVMLMSGYVDISIVTDLVLYRDITQEGDREEVSYTSLTGGESIGDVSGSQLLKISRFYSYTLKVVLYELEIGGGGVTVGVHAPGEICAALWRTLDALCSGRPTSTRQ